MALTLELRDDAVVAAGGAGTVRTDDSALSVRFAARDGLHGEAHGRVI